MSTIEDRVIASENSTAGVKLQSTDGFAVDGLTHLFHLALALVSVLVILSTAFVALVHIDDHFMLEHVSGAWLAQAQSAAEGVLYPLLYDGEHYGGTRVMPLSIILHAGLGNLTGDLVASGKLLNFAACAALGLTVFMATASTGLGLPQRLFLSTIAWLTYPGLLVAAGIRNDALPVVLQLAAVLLIERRGRPAEAIGAGVLCAFAVLAKMSALWAPAAIGLYLLIYDPRRLVLFLPAMLATLVIGILGANALSDGRMFENLRVGTFGAGLDARAIVENAKRFVVDFTDRALVVWVLFPIALLAVAGTLATGAVTVLHLSFLFAVVLTLAIYMDPGAWSNHLIDLIVLVPLVAAGVWSRSERVGAAAIAALLLFAAASATINVGNSLSAMASTIVGSPTPRDPIAEHVSPDQSILSQDPYLPIVRGQRPVIGDPFMIRRIEKSDPTLVAPLVERIRGKAFERVVLIFDLSDTTNYLRGAHFTEEIWRAITDNYVLTAGPVDGRYFIYSPRT